MRGAGGDRSGRAEGGVLSPSHPFSLGWENPLPDHNRTLSPSPAHNRILAPPPRCSPHRQQRAPRCTIPAVRAQVVEGRLLPVLPNAERLRSDVLLEQAPDRFAASLECETQGELEQGRPVLEFLIWCGFPDAPRCAWHRMRVSKALEGPRDDSFTHDASVIGDSAPHGVRGVQLDSAGWAAGLWMPIAKRQGGGSGVSEGGSSSAAASDAGRGGTARKRPMREAQSKLGPDRYIE